MLMAFGLVSGDANKYFVVVLGLAISTTTISYIAIFPALIKLRMSHAHVHRPYSVPGGMAGVWLIGILTTAFAILATAALLYPGILTAAPDASLPSNFTRGQYELTQVLPLVVLFIIGGLFYVGGSGVRSKMVQVSLDDDQPLSAGGSST